MKQLGISIIGTDTDVGKTFVTGLLGAMAVDDGFAVGMVKPVSSSAVPFPECVTMDEDNYNVGLESKDATHLMRAAGIPESRRHEVNPYAIAGDFSPRLAAELAGIEIDYDGVVAHTLDVVNRYDLTFVEGAGGITTPLYGDKTFTDFITIHASTASQTIERIINFYPEDRRQQVFSTDFFWDTLTK